MTYLQFSSIRFPLVRAWGSAANAVTDLLWHGFRNLDTYFPMSNSAFLDDLYFRGKVVMMLIGNMPELF